MFGFILGFGAGFGIYMLGVANGQRHTEELLAEDWHNFMDYLTPELRLEIRINMRQYKQSSGQFGSNVLS